ncbi:hypothetical protein U1Q18_033066 [Sarracenia purpurea var. burkii]
MAGIHIMSVIVLFALLSLQLTASTDPPNAAPSPAPEPEAGSDTPPSESLAPAIPSPSPELSPIPASPPPDFAPGSSPTVSPPNKAPSPVPAPSVPSDSGSVKSNVNADAEEPKESSGGLNARQKAGIVLGVIAGVCVVALGGILYRKRQQNIQRSQYGYAARREIL